ncbi:MAG: sigma-70 family RNA polymerase sigma factor [Myxococcales bacterium FL481]|nr:MAG: sigma-70 family RNA polymerase sigma factor [Myxococcales bacterium FL481]
MPPRVERCDTDAELLNRWRAGETKAGETLFSRHLVHVYRFFRNKCAGDADDLVQSTFLACLRGRDQFEGRSSFRTYLYTIARNELYRHLRKSRKLAREVDFSTDSVAAILTGAGTMLDRKRAMANVRNALMRLPVDQQLLLELHYWHELDPRALGEVFGVLPGTIRTRLFRARRILRGSLEPAIASSADLARLVRTAVDA